MSNTKHENKTIKCRPYFTIYNLLLKHKKNDFMLNSCCHRIPSSSHSIEPTQIMSSLTPEQTLSCIFTLFFNLHDRILPTNQSPNIIEELIK